MSLVSTACVSCSRKMRTSAESKSPTCRPCRRARPARDDRLQVTRACAWCSTGFRPWRTNPGQRYCSQACGSRASAVARGRAQTPKGQRAGRRRDRESSAAGLTAAARRRLRLHWVARGIGCAFCDGAAETVDHVIPLSRGGSNFEGNLLPACRRCNSARSDLLLSEWRHGGRRRSDYVHRPELRAARPKREVPPRPRCELCGDKCPARRRRFCSDACSLEFFARQQRDAYRVAHGLPVDPAQPTRPRRRTWEVTSCQLELVLSAA